MYVVVPVERAAGASDADADAYYQSLIEGLGSWRNARIIERKALRTVLDERDLALALDPEAADRTYAASVGKLNADHVLVPGLCKLQSDYILSLRLISVRGGTTEACVFRRTRLSGKFADQASGLLEDLLGKRPTEASSASAEPLPPSKPALDQLRAECRLAQADGFFPSLWDRAEKLYAESAARSDAAEVASYYIGLLHLCLRATSPPEGMVFVPGGWVRLAGLGEPRRLWVEPFFMDRCEVPVGEYTGFMESLGKTDEGRSKLRA